MADDILVLREPVLGLLSISDDESIPVMVHDDGKHFIIEASINDRDPRVLDEWVINADKESQISFPLHTVQTVNGLHSDKKLPYDLLVTAKNHYFVFVDCHVANGRIYMETPEANTARIEAGYVIIDPVVVCANYRRIKNLQASFEGLNDWLRFSPISGDPLPEDTRQSRIVLNPSLRIYAKTDESFMNSSGHVESHKRVYEINSKRVQDEDWATHLRRFRNLRALVEISAYAPLPYTYLSTRQYSRPVDWDGLTFGGGIHSLRIMSHRPEVVPEPGRETNYRMLFYYTNTGREKGVARWFALLDKYSQGLNTLIYLIENKNHVRLESDSLLLATALEYIGYNLFKKKPTVLPSFESDLNKILDDIGTDCFPFKYNVDPDATSRPKRKNFKKNAKKQWTDFMNTVYQSTKHADRETPSADELFLFRQQGILILRIWVAKKIGLDMHTLFTALSSDAQATSFGMNVINPYDRELQLYRSISSLIRRYIRNTISI